MNISRKRIQKKQNSSWQKVRSFIFWKGDPALIKKTIDKGYDVVNSYHEYTYVDYNYESIPLSKAYAFNPVPEGLSPEEQSRVLGLGCQMWVNLFLRLKA